MFVCLHQRLKKHRMRKGQRPKKHRLGKGSNVKKNIRLEKIPMPKKNLFLVTMRIIESISERYFLRHLKDSSKENIKNYHKLSSQKTYYRAVGSSGP